MRFKTIDLLTATTLIAVYSLMASRGLFGSLEGLYALRWLTLTMLFAVFFIARLLNFVSSAAGPLVCRLHSKIPWRTHFLVAAMALGLGLYQTKRDVGIGSASSSTLPFVITQIYILLLSTRTALHETGLTISRNLFRYREHRFMLRETHYGTELVFDGKWPPWLRVFENVVLVPKDRIEEVQKALAARQPEIDEAF